MKRGRDGHVRSDTDAVTRQQALSMLKEMVSPPVYDAIVAQSTANLLQLIATLRPGGQ